MDDNVLRCIFYCEFDTVLGPKITYQCPERYLRSEVFEATHEYFITKPQLCGRVICLRRLHTAQGVVGVMGCSVQVEGARYLRNLLLFNVCFVFAEPPATRPAAGGPGADWAAAYEPVVRKLAGWLRALECDTGFLSGPGKHRLPDLLHRMWTDLRRRGECQLQIGDDGANTIYLKVMPRRAPPPPIYEHDVPVLVRDVGALLTADWELAVQQIVPYIDGVRHVRSIAEAAGLASGLVSEACRHLYYYDCLRVIDVFQYSNMYAATPQLHQLRQSHRLQLACLQYVVRRGGTSSVEQVMALYGALKPCTPLADFCTAHDLAASDIDLRRFITFGLLNRLIRRMHHWPLRLALGDDAIRVPQEDGELDGTQPLDAVCTALAVSAEQAREQLAHSTVPPVMFVR